MVGSHLLYNSSLVNSIIGSHWLAVSSQFEYFILMTSQKFKILKICMNISISRVYLLI